MTVRDCDLDMYGVVNNAVYASYIETGLLYHPNNPRIKARNVSRYSFPNPWSMYGNHVYMQYPARQEMAASLGVCTGSIVRTGRAMALSELNVKYFAPLKVHAWMHVNSTSFFILKNFTRFFCGHFFYTLCVVYLHECLYILQRGAMFVVMVRVVQIKGVRMLVEHLIATLPDRKVGRLSPIYTLVTSDHRPTGADLY